MDMNEDGSGTIQPLFDQQKSHSSPDQFTDEDRLKIEKLIEEEVTTEHYVEVVKLIEQLESAKNKDENLLEDLQELKKQIEELEQEIKDINQTILDELYPFNDISRKDREVVHDIIKRYQKLSPYDQTKVQGYEDVEKAEAQIDSLIRA